MTSHPWIQPTPFFWWNRRINTSGFLQTTCSAGLSLTVDVHRQINGLQTPQAEAGVKANRRSFRCTSWRVFEENSLFKQDPGSSREKAASAFWGAGGGGTCFPFFFLLEMWSNTLKEESVGTEPRVGGGDRAQAVLTPSRVPRWHLHLTAPCTCLLRPRCRPEDDCEVSPRPVPRAERREHRASSRCDLTGVR